MIKSLVYLNTDLASSIALRYACRLSEMTEMEINPIHVATPEAEVHSSGTGWASRTWESSLIQQAKEKIIQLIASEKAHCPELNPPKILLGEPEHELLREVKQTNYDLFLIGILRALSPQQFYNRMHSKFYQKVRCPILVVKDLTGIDKIALLVEPGEKGNPQAQAFVNLFKGVDVTVDLLQCGFRKPAAAQPDAVTETPLAKDAIQADETLANASRLLQDNGCKPGAVTRIEGSPNAVGKRLSDYHLVLTSLPHHIGPTSPLLDCLSRVPSALLFCRE